MSGIRAHFALKRGDFSLAVDFSLPAVGVSALFGPSGAGKSCCLRVLAGLDRDATGFLALGEHVWLDSARGIFVPPHRRAVGMVFQEASLFPHLSVRANLEFGWRYVPAAQRRITLADVVAWLDLATLLPRDPAGLSGGERQRVAIGRALLTSPRLLLLDEPLSALDLKRRQEILPYLERLREVLAIPMVYVSHAPDEVARLADHLVLLDGGQVTAAGPLAETLARLDLAHCFSDDAGVVIAATIAAHEADDLTRLHFPGGEILVSRLAAPPGASLRCRVHARDVSLARVPPEQSSILNRVQATVLAVQETGVPGQVLVRLDAGGTALLARVTARSVRALGIEVGVPLCALIKSVAVLA